jgi:hypothetical protein
MRNMTLTSARMCKNTILIRRLGIVHMIDTETEGILVTRTLMVGFIKRKVNMSVKNLRDVINSAKGDVVLMSGVVASAIHAAGYRRIEEIEVDYEKLMQHMKPESRWFQTRDKEEAEAHRHEWLKGGA